MDPSDFSKKLILWQRRFGRHGLPWQVNDAYRRWLSEVMLQQTQVSVVIDYFSRFLLRFPTVQSLAQSDLDDVYRLWAGLGYYARAKHLHQCAKMICDQYDGRFPETVEELVKLPGIGRSTAGAITSFSYGKPTPILDGNVKRIFTRVYRIGTPLGKAQAEKKLWSLAEALVPKKEAGTYNQALMDLGAALCTKTHPKCERCPLRDVCSAHRENREESYPVREKKEKKPIRAVRMTVYIKRQKLWLTQRSQKAVWEGLWSLPENRPEQGTSLTTFTHVFSHYKLEASVEICPWKKRKDPDTNGRWFSLEEAITQALPSPIKRMLLANASALGDSKIVLSQAATAQEDALDSITCNSPSSK